MSAPEFEEWLDNLRGLHEEMALAGNGDTSYGPCSVDPRNFSPDHECSTEEERALHKADCERLERGEKVATPTRCEVTDPAPGVTMIKMPSGYGLGVNTYEGDPNAADYAERLGIIIDQIERWKQEQA